MLDGSFHPITVAARSSQLRVFASPWYLAPGPVDLTSGVMMPRVLWDALNSDRQLTGIAVAPRAWYFPNRTNGLATVPLAAEIAIQQGSPLFVPAQLVATLIDERQGRRVGFSSETLDWSHGPDSVRKNDTLRLAHWFQTVNLPPGSYQLRVAALDPSTKSIGTATWRFLIGPRDEHDRLAVSSFLLASSCDSAATQPSQRRNLLDPLEVKDCRLVPAASSNFSQDDTMRALVRLYPAGNSRKDFPQRWTATMSIWEPGKGKPLIFPVPIEASGAGWAAFAEFPFPQLGLAPGDYQINVTFQGPKAKQTFSLQTRFEILQR